MQATTVAFSETELWRHTGHLSGALGNVLSNTESRNAI
jgi:hypothetical protein